MPRRCVLVGCSNTSREGYVLHQWPKDPKIGRKWKRFVKMTRKWTHPTQWTALCSRHFQDDCYETTELEIFFGYRKKWKSDAVPTIKTSSHELRSISSSLISDDEERVSLTLSTLSYLALELAILTR
ncbi:THAP domain-containing protein 2 [Nymphon striatum]|nr:THAP domain-containing protein 2 [Nymphon striatum]